MVNEMKKAKRSLKISIMALILAIILSISLCLAWFWINDKATLSSIDFIVTDRAFSLGTIIVNVDDDDEGVKENEFRGLLPGTKFVFEVPIKRKVAGDLTIKIEFTGITGDDFVGKIDGITHNMTELFCATPLNSQGKPTAELKYFNNNINGTMVLIDNIKMPSNVNEVRIMFLVQFNTGNIEMGMEQLSADISKKSFNIQSIYIS